MIYLLEDDNSIRKLVSYALKSSGYEVLGLEKPSDFWKALDQQLPQLILLDIMLPEESGLEVLERLKQDAVTRSIAVIMLTAKSNEIDRVIGLDSGADDYIAKPFGMMELISRVKAVLRRTESRSSGEEAVQVGPLYLCPSKHIVRVNGENVTLTLKEFKLLCYLIEQNGQVSSRDELLSAVWGYAFNGESRTVDVHIRKLRQKLGEAGKYIETVKGIGYKFGDGHE